MSDSLENLLRRIDSLIREYNELSGYSSTHRLQKPTTEADITRLESELGVVLPGDYRAFLLKHNGWIDFEGEVSLLSTDEMRSGPIFNNVQELKHIYREAEDDIAANGIVIAASPTGTIVKFFDLSTQQPNGSMELVEWNMEEVIRHRGFLEFLDFTAESWQRLIRQIQERERTT